MTLVANGITAEMPMSVACDVAETLVMTGRAIPADKWVADYVSWKQGEALESLL